MEKLFALVDANNFYVSCERVFDPSIEEKPVVVLSNNDGCAVSRSQEAKKIGVKMGAPYFQIREEFGDQVIAKSSNYSLYGEMSRRFHTLVSYYASHQEMYSIDESFLDFTENPHPLSTATQIYARCKRDLGLPVCVGLGATKTRAKLANMLAKKRNEYRGRCHIEEIPKLECENIFRSYDVGEVWGIGRNHREHLARLGIHTVYDLSLSDPLVLRKEFSIVMEKTVRELQGESCLEIEEIPTDRKMIMTSRSFGEMVQTKAHLREALTYFTTRGAEKLRAQSSEACAITVFLRSNKHRHDLEQYSNSTTVTFLDPTDDTGVFIRGALEGLDAIYREGISYKKAGVLIHQIEPKDGQLVLRMIPQDEKRKSLMHTLDAINRKYGKSKLFFAGQGVNQHWKMLAERRSPLYLHRWSDVPWAS